MGIGPQLVNTIFFMCAVYFTLRSGQEHKALRFKPPQIYRVSLGGRGGVQGVLKIVVVVYIMKI